VRIHDLRHAFASVGARLAAKASSSWGASSANSAQSMTERLCAPERRSERAPAAERIRQHHRRCAGWEAPKAEVVTFNQERS
jgi:hypothetical protein